MHFFYLVDIDCRCRPATFFYWSTVTTCTFTDGWRSMLSKCWHPKLLHFSSHLRYGPIDIGLSFSFRSSILHFHLLDLIKFRKSDFSQQDVIFFKSVILFMKWAACCYLSHLNGHMQKCWSRYQSEQKLAYWIFQKKFFKLIKIGD